MIVDLAIKALLLLLLLKHIPVPWGWILKGIFISSLLTGLAILLAL